VIKGEMVGNQLDLVTWQIKWMVALDRVKWNLQWGCRVFKNCRMIMNEHI
jgi:ABC-type sulfate transport system permease subunit